MKIQTIKHLRTTKGLTGKQVAEHLGISSAHYVHLENGRRRFKPALLKRLADVFECDYETVKIASSNIDDFSFLVANWIARIPLDGDILINKYIETIRGNEFSKKSLKSDFIRFFEKHIESSVRNELEKDDRILDYIAKKAGIINN